MIFENRAPGSLSNKQEKKIIGGSVQALLLTALAILGVCFENSPGIDFTAIVFLHLLSK
jgi:hypothetical protein